MIALGRKRTATRVCNRPQGAVQLADLKSRVGPCWPSQEDSHRVLNRAEDPAEILREMKRLRTQAPGMTRMDPTQNAAKETQAREYLLLAETAAVVTMQNTR